MKPKPCFDFRDTGSCKHGNDCRWSHDPDIIKAARRDKNQMNAYLKQLEKDWDKVAAQWQGKGGKKGRGSDKGSGSWRSKGKSKGRGKSSKGSDKGSGKGDRNKGKGAFNFNMEQITKMSKEQAQAALAQFAMTPSGKKPKRTESHRWTQDTTSAEFRKWQSEQQKNNPQYKQRLCKFANDKSGQGCSKGIWCTYSHNTKKFDGSGRKLDGKSHMPTDAPGSVEPDWTAVAAQASATPTAPPVEEWAPPPRLVHFPSAGSGGRMCLYKVTMTTNLSLIHI